MGPRAASSRLSRAAVVTLASVAAFGCATAPPPKKTYRVLGKTYAPLPSAEGYSEAGIASWYGTDFHGKLTSNGEVYDMYARTSAHKLLPLGTTVRVTNLENGTSAIARINDRGPFVEGRIIDLSYTLACDLGMAEKGTARVLVEAISGPGGTTAPGRALAGPFAWQVGAYAVPATAQALAENLKAQFREVAVERYQRGETALHRVRVGSYPTLAEAAAAKSTLVDRGFSPILVRKD